MVLSGVLWAAPADATTTHVVERAEQTTFAEFVAVHGCLRTKVYVYGLHLDLQDGDQQGTQTNAMVAISRRNSCTHTLIAAPFGSATGEEVFGFNRRLWNAHVKATIPVQDGGVGPVSYVRVDVTWHGTGRVQTDDHHDVVKQPTYTYIADTRDSARPADATGQITQDGTSIFDGPAISAAMTDTHFESRTISTQ